MKQNKMLYAITGGIGTGKSMVRRIVQALGGYTIDADSINRELMKKPSYIEKLKLLFPQAVENGEINRQKLADRVFSDKSELIKLNSLAHPLITGLIMYEAGLVVDNDVFVEVPLLINSEVYEVFDKIWLVKADKDLRLKRVLTRDNRNPEQVKNIMLSQDNEEDIEKLASAVIENNGSEEELWGKVQKVYLSRF